MAAGTNPAGVAVSPGGDSVFVTNPGNNTVSQFNVGAGGALTPKSPATVAAGNGPFGVAVSPDGGSVYVTNDTDNSVSQFDVAVGGLLTPKSPPTVPAGLSPAWVAVSPAITPPIPTSAKQCKNGGWRTFGVFKNQGDCVSFVATGGKNQPKTG